MWVEVLRGCCEVEKLQVRGKRYVEAYHGLSGICHRSELEMLKYWIKDDICKQDNKKITVPPWHLTAGIIFRIIIILLHHTHNEFFLSKDFSLVSSVHRTQTQSVLFSSTNLQSWSLGKSLSLKHPPHYVLRSNNHVSSSRQVLYSSG